MSITKCACAAMRTKTEGTLHQAGSRQARESFCGGCPPDFSQTAPTSTGSTESNLHSIRWRMSTPDQLLYVALHGTAMRYATERRNLDESIEELRDIADGRNDILAQAAGITAGSWYAWPSTHIGHELIAAGMMILAGGGRGLPLDYDELERWTRVGFERGTRSRKGER
jgi:hypothetical protein